MLYLCTNEEEIKEDYSHNIWYDRYCFLSYY